MRRSVSRIRTTALTGFESPDSCAFERNDNWVDPDNGGTSDTKGWLPIGEEIRPLKLIVKGNGNTISNIYINRSGSNRIGLLGCIDRSERNTKSRLREW